MTMYMLWLSVCLSVSLHRCLYLCLLSVSVCVFVWVSTSSLVATEACSIHLSASTQLTWVVCWYVVWRKLQEPIQIQCERGSVWWTHTCQRGRHICGGLCEAMLWSASWRYMFSVAMVRSKDRRLRLLVWCFSWHRTAMQPCALRRALDRGIYNTNCAIVVGCAPGHHGCRCCNLAGLKRRSWPATNHGSALKKDRR